MGSEKFGSSPEELPKNEPSPHIPHIKERKETSEEAAKELMQEHSRIYKEALTIVEKTGLSKNEAEILLEDETNPYIGDLFDFVETMRKNGTHFVGTNKNNMPVFEDTEGMDKGTKYTVRYVKTAFKWKEHLYPELKRETIDKAFPWDLVEKVIFAKLPMMQRFLEAQNNLGTAVGMRNELRHVRKLLKEGYSMSEISDLLKNRNHNKIAEPMEAMSAILSAREDAEQEKRMERNMAVDEQLKEMPEHKEVLQLYEEVHELDDVTPEDLPEFLAKVDGILDSLAGENEELQDANMDFKEALQEIEQLTTDGEGGGEMEDFTKSAEIFKKIGAKFTKLMDKAEAENDYETQAKLGLYEGIAELSTVAIHIAYSPEDESEE